MAASIDFKIVLLGKEYAGKTCLITRFLHDYYNDEAPYKTTIGAAFGMKTLSILNQVVNLSIWDTAGAERFNAMTKLYYRDASAAILCFDLTDSESFQRVKYWFQEIRNTEENCRVYLCGTKHDLVLDGSQRRAIDANWVKNYAQNIEAPYFETSSKKGENIDKLFLRVAEDLVRSRAAPKRQEMDIVQVAEERSSSCPCWPSDKLKKKKSQTYRLE